MIRRTFLGLLALASLLSVSSPAPAAPNNVISQNVAVCDPYAPSQCSRPGAVTATTAASTGATITLGNTFQTLLAGSSKRQGCSIQNPTTATEVLYVNFGVLGSATTANSFSIPAGGSINCSNANGSLNGLAVNVTAATTSHAFVYTVF